MGKYRLLALVDQKLPAIGAYSPASQRKRTNERAQLFEALSIVERAGFSILPNEHKTVALDSFYQEQAIRMLIEINPQILADDATRRRVIAEGYDFCVKLQPDFEDAANRAVSSCSDLRGGPLIRAFFKMQHDLQRFSAD